MCVGGGGGGGGTALRRLKCLEGKHKLHFALLISNVHSVEHQTVFIVIQ